MHPYPGTLRPGVAHNYEIAATYRSTFIVYPYGLDLDDMYLVPSLLLSKLCCRKFSLHRHKDHAGYWLTPYAAMLAIRAKKQDCGDSFLIEGGARI